MLTPCSEVYGQVYGVLIGLSEVFVAVNDCLESSPQIRQVWGPVYLAVFVIHRLCHPDHISEWLSVLSAHIYVPLFGGFHGQSACDLVSSYMDVRLYLDRRGMLLSLGAAQAAYKLRVTGGAW